MKVSRAANWKSNGNIEVAKMFQALIYLLFQTYISQFIGTSGTIEAILMGTSEGKEWVGTAKKLNDTGLE